MVAYLGREQIQQYIKTTNMTKGGNTETTTVG